MKSYLAIILAVFLVAAVTSVSAAPATCSERTYVRIADCFTNAIFVGQKSLPITGDQVAADYCPQVALRITCIGKVRKCLGGFKETLFGIVFRGLKNFLRSQCKTPSSMENLANQMNCVEGENIGNETVIDRFAHEITLMLNLASSKGSEGVIPQLCCGYHFLLNKIQDAADKFCTKNNVPLKGKDFYSSVIYSALNDATDLVCGKFTSTAICEKDLPTGNAEMVALMNAPKLEEVNEPLFSSILRAVDTISDDFQS